MTIVVLAALFLGSVAVNFFHWRAHPGERFFYYPSRGWLRLFFIWCSLATLALAILFLIGVASMTAFSSVMFGVGVAGEFYSLGYRQCRKEQRECNVA